jgi:hypothetical protein
MTPEILHRCESCGVIIREPAMFCPECGKPLKSKADQPGGNDEVVEPNEDAAVNVVQEPPSNAPVIPSRTPPPPRMEGTRSPGTERHRARERTRETLQRASSVARGAIEDNVKRVEKIHHVSSVMFEEAHYDPSLRFVLVALGLFLIFVILLVLSKVMG